MEQKARKTEIVSPSSIISQYNFHLKAGQPFDWRDRQYLRTIYDIPFKYMFLMKGRQVEGSTLLANQILIPTSLYKSFNSLYITPSIPQTKLFSIITLKEILRATKFLNHLHYPDRLTLKNVYHKSFSNGSHILFRYANPQTVERIRGIPGINLLALDEIQDLLIDLLPVIYETQSHIKEKQRLITGTPKSFAHPTEYFWQKSQRIEWVVKCSHCNYENILNERNIEKKGLSCAKCKKLITVQEGRWVKTNPTASMIGFRLHQLMMPFISWEDILEKRETYSDTKFKNEVLAMSAESATRGLPPSVLQKACRPYHLLSELTSEWESGYRFAGIDWGLGEISYTVLSIYGLKNGKLYLIYVKRYRGYEADLLTACDDIIAKLARFRVTFTFADFGFGAGLNERIRDEFDNFATVQFTNIQQTIKWIPKSHRYQASRDMCITAFFDEIRKEKMFFPYWDEFEPYGQDILHEYTEYDEKNHTMRYIHNEPDDVLFSSLYAWLAYVCARVTL